MPTCKEVSRAVAADELLAAGWRKRLQIRLHLFMCGPCRRYARQIRHIGTAARELLGNRSLDTPARDTLRDAVLKVISGTSQDSRSDD